MADVGCAGLTECCYCRGSLREPAVLLNCLHNCCRSCHESHVKQISQSTVKCIDSCESTEALVLTNGIPAAYAQCAQLQSDEACCKTCPESDVAAVYWCTDCSRLLCANCYGYHNTFSLQCHRSAELREARTWSFGLLIRACQCSIHKQGFVAHCLTCRQPKCFMCFEKCGTFKHDWRTLSHNETVAHVRRVTEDINVALPKLDDRLSDLSAKIRSLLGAVQIARFEPVRGLLRRRKVVKNSVVKEHAEAERTVYESLQWEFYKGTSVMAQSQSMRKVGTSAASTMELFILTTTFNNLSFLRAKDRHRAIARSSIRPLRALAERQLRCISKRRTLVIYGSIPDTAPMLLSACLGAADRRLASPLEPLLFDKASVSFPVPIDCEDLALTQDGRTLLAARQHGLLEYSDHGQQLRSWNPTRRSNGWADAVSCVAVLKDGRVAVGVVYARLVVLLRRRSETDDTWFEDRCVIELPLSSPWRLAVCGDFLAMADTEPDDQQDLLPGRDVQLRRLSTGQPIGRQRRDYRIRSVALTTRCVITMGEAPVKRNDGLKYCLVDAFSHADELLWQHKASDDELLMSVCSAESLKLVYVALKKRNQKSSRVLAINGADGSGMADVLSSSTCELQAPDLMALSRGQQRIFLAARSFDVTDSPTLTLYEATLSGESEAM